MPAVPCITYELRIFQAVSVLLAALQLPSQQMPALHACALLNLQRHTSASCLLVGRLQDGLHLPDGPPGYVHCTDAWQSGWCRPGSCGLPAVL